jgi:hypothetical protein
MFFLVVVIRVLTFMNVEKFKSNFIIRAEISGTTDERIFKIAALQKR